MKNELKEYLDAEIPQLAGKTGLKRLLALFRLRRYYPSCDAVYMLRYCCVYRSAGGLRKLLRMHFRRLLVNRYGIFFDPAGTGSIGKGLFLPHPTSIVIGSGVKIGENCTIYQNVTLGAKKKGAAAKDEYPLIGNNCVFYAGAVAAGAIRVADGTQLGANSVLLSDTEENGVYAGAPAERKSRKK